MTVPTILSGLSVREAIADAVYRGVLSIDTADAVLFDSSFTDDAVLELNGKIIKGRAALHKEVFDPVSKLDTTHLITNMRVEVKEGESKASGTSSALAQHFREGQGKEPGATRYMSAGLYSFDCVKDEKDGLWKMTYWKLQSIWSEGDAGVMTGN